MKKNTAVLFDFPRPLVESVFLRMLLYSLSINTFEYDPVKTSESIKILYNGYFNTTFSKHSSSIDVSKSNFKANNSALLLLSFGKESLLTYALLKELRIKVIPVYIAEPSNIFENRNKTPLIKEFFKKVTNEIISLKLPVGNLRFRRDYWWGWDIVLSQYTLLMLPYCFKYKASYLFFGNEQSCNFTLVDREGYYINTVYEQSVEGMTILQDILSIFGLPTVLGSPVEPIHELFITRILQRRYPKIGRYLTSCFSESPESAKRRWCANCDKCAYMYLFLKAFGINPISVGFTPNTNMLSRRNEKFFTMFSTSSKQSAFGSTGLRTNEQLLAFYLAYKRGVKGVLIDFFKKTYLTSVEKNLSKLIDEYFGIHSMKTIPTELKPKLLNIFKEEQTKALKEIRKLVKR